MKTQFICIRTDKIGNVARHKSTLSRVESDIV